MIHDLVHAVRSLVRTPVFFATAVVTLGLGIGANTAVFSVVHGLLLRPLAFPRQHELVFLGEHSEQIPNLSVAYPNFLDWRERQRSFSSIGAFRPQSYNWIGANETERVSGTMVSHDLIETLGVKPLLGRSFAAADDRPGAERTVLISERFWRRVFGGQISAVGETLTLSGQLYTVIGVMPREFEFPVPESDLHVPLGLFAGPFGDRGSHPGIYVIGRLRSGISFERAVEDMRAVTKQLAEDYPTTNAGNSVAAELLVDRYFADIRPALLALFGGALCVLLIACSNVANLLFARAATRSREFVVRIALGADRGRLIRALLMQSGMLGLAGSGAGILLAMATLGAVTGILPAGLPNADRIAINVHVLTFSLALGVGTTVIFGLFPAFGATRVNLQQALAQGGRGSSALGRGRSVLIVGQFALTLALLTGASLMLRTLINLHRSDPGFRTEGVLTFNWVMPGAAYADPGRRIRLLESALEKLRLLPGVSQAALVFPVPLTGGNQTSFFVEGSPVVQPGQLPFSEFGPVSPNYFDAMGIRFIAGRVFTPADHAQAPRVAIVDATFVEKFFPGENPIGKRLTFHGLPGPENPWVEIVGVVQHIQNYGIGGTTRQQAYVPYTQEVPHAAAFVLRTESDPAALSAGVRRVMREVDPGLPAFQFRTMHELFNATIRTEALALRLFGAFAVLALALAAIGMYGVLSTAVSQRSREFGVRLAIGASPAQIFLLVTKQGLRLALAGMAAGVVLALGGTRLIASKLYGVSVFDPLSFGAVAVGLLGIGWLACAAPAWRATRVDPVEALRTD